MKVRLDRLGDEPHTWHESLKLTRGDLDHPDVISLSEVDCRGSLRRTTAGFLLEISMSYEQTLACTRCLGTIRLPVGARIGLLVVVEDEAMRRSGPSEERELDEGELGMLVLPGPHLDTRPYVVEQMQLNVPMKSLCRDDCAGLCTTCGADLNGGPCDCEPVADKRWAALAKLKETS